MSKQHDRNRGRKKADDTIMNDAIRINELRVLSDDGEQLGILSRDEAMQIAEEKGLDLVLMSPDAKPPVAKIMDYGKHKYELEKKKKEARRNQKKIEVKEVKFSCKIAENDINYKIEHVNLLGNLTPIETPVLSTNEHIYNFNDPNNFNYVNNIS